MAERVGPGHNARMSTLYPSQGVPFTAPQSFYQDRGGDPTSGGGAPGGGGLPILQTSQNPAAGALTAPSTVTSAGSPMAAGAGAAGAGMAISPNTWAQLIGMGLGFAGNLMGEDQPQQFMNQTGTFAGTGMDPRKLAEIQAGLIGGMGDLTSQVTSRPIDLSGSIVQQPPSFTGGPLPFNVGVTGVDPAMANPALVQLPGLDSSAMMDAIDAIKALGVSNISGQDLADMATPEEKRQSEVRRESDSRVDTDRFGVPRSLGDPGKGMFPTDPTLELSDFQKEFIDQEKIRRGIQEATQESPISNQVRRRQPQMAAPGGLEVLQQAATQPGKGVRRRAE